MTLLEAQTFLADERASFIAEEHRLKADCAAAERLQALASSLFMSFAQKRHDHLKPFVDAVTDAAKVHVVGCS